MDLPVFDGTTIANLIASPNGIAYSGTTGIEELVQGLFDHLGAYLIFLGV